MEAVTYDEDGCCKICSEPEKLGNHYLMKCTVLTVKLSYLKETCALSLKKKVWPLELEIPLDGHQMCRNSEMLTEWSLCKGSCQSGVKYNSGMLNLHESND